MNKNIPVEIVEVYKDYTPPIDVRKAIHILLRRIPTEHLMNLKSVVLTNSGNLNSRRRRDKTWSRKRKVRISESQGVYHSWENNSPARIELFVDNIIADWPILMLRVPPIRDTVFANVLFHEIGHHIHRRMAPESGEPEDIANRWRDKLFAQYTRKYHWYMKVILLPLRPFRRQIKEYAMTST